MYSAVSNNIRVTVEPKFLAEQSEPDDDVYFWAYTIEIANGGETSVQLTHRHWKIVDANGRLPGLVGCYWSGRGPKYFKGPGRPSLGDLTFTEFAIFGH